MNSVLLLKERLRWERLRWVAYDRLRREGANVETVHRQWLGRLGRNDVRSSSLLERGTPLLRRPGTAIYAPDRRE